MASHRMACLREKLTLRVRTNSVLCLQCGKWIYGRCAGVKMVTPKFKKNLHAENLNGILERQWNRKKRYVMKWKL